MRIVFALGLLAHGIAHMVGYLKADGPRWRQAVGVGWLLLAIGFAATATAAALGIDGWTTVAVRLAITSTALCVAQLPETLFGLIVNVALLTAMFLMRHTL